MIKLRQVNKQEFLQELKYRVEQNEISEEEISSLIKNSSQRINISKGEKISRVDFDNLTIETESKKKEKIEKLFRIVKDENIKELEYLVKRGIFDIINSVDEKGNTVLHYAVTKGNENLTNILLEVKEIDVNIQNKKEKETPLHLAVKNIEKENYKKISKSLSEKNFDPLLGNKYGNTVFHYVAEKNDWEIFKNLFEKTKEKKGDSFNINNIRNNFDWPVINSAAFGITRKEEDYQENDLKIIKILLQEWKNRNDNKLSIEEIFAVEELLEEKPWEYVEKYRNLVKDIVKTIKKEWEKEREFKNTYMIEISK